MIPSRLKQAVLTSSSCSAEPTAMAQEQRPDAQVECPPTAPCKFIALRGGLQCRGASRIPYKAANSSRRGPRGSPPPTASRTRRLPATCRFRPDPALVTGFSCLPLTGTVQSAPAPGLFSAASSAPAMSQHTQEAFAEIAGHSSAVTIHWAQRTHQHQVAPC